VHDELLSPLAVLGFRKLLYDGAMRDLAVLFLHLATVVRLAGPAARGAISTDILEFRARVLVRGDAVQRVEEEPLMFRKYGLDRRYGAVLVTYADDFVVLCRHGAAEVLATTRRWMTGIGLSLNETKTRVCDARCESFDFLGYTFGPMHSREPADAISVRAPRRKPWPRFGTRFVDDCGSLIRRRGRRSCAP
jgi:hypothetical protein